MFSNLVMGFSVALSPENLFYCFLGVTIGNMVGILPGIGPTAGIAILMPMAAGMNPISAVIMLCGIYYGSMYGGSITSVLLNMPGEAASVPTAMEGYQLTRQGRGGAALGMSAFASFVAGTVSIVGLMLLAPALADFAFTFGPPEYFALMILGLTLVISLSGKSLIKGLTAGIIGLVIAMVGIDPQSGITRFTFGNVNLMGGIDFLSAIIGFFAISEVLDNVDEISSDIGKIKLKNLLPTLRDWAVSWGAMIRGSVLGFFAGIIPGVSATVAAFLSYDLEKKLSKHPEKFGTGRMEVIASVEAANNSVVGGGLIPLLTLGVPPSGPMAMLLGALMMHGLQPGPMLFANNPSFVWGVIASMYIGNILLLILSLFLLNLWVRIVRIPYGLLAPIILVLCFIGTYSLRNNIFDVFVTLFLGVLGYAMRKLDFPTAPVVLAMILAQMFENALRQSLTISAGSPAIFFQNPIAAVLLIAAFLSAAFNLFQSGRLKKARVSEAA